MKKALSKIMLLVLCFTFVFTGLVACGTDELDQKIEDLKEQVNQNNAKDQADAAALAELKALVEQVKATADAAALKTSLDAVIADLEALEGASATQAKLDEVKAGLEAALANNANADAATKANLLNAIAAVDTIAKAAATKTDLDAAKADLAAAKTELNAAIAAVKATADAAATKAEIEAVEARLDAAKAELETAIAAVKATADAAATKDALDAAKADLDAAIAAVKATADAAATKAEFDAAKAELETAIGAVETIANAAATKAELDAAKAELNAAIDAVKGTANNAATKAELADVKADLDAAIAAVEAAATKDELVAAKAELLEAIAAVEATANAAATKVEFDAAKAELDTAIGNLEAADTALEGKINAAKTELEGKIDAAKTELQAQINALSAKLDADIPALDARITALENNTALADLSALVDVIKADVDALKELVNNLQGSNFVDNFENATKVLNGDLRVVIVDGEIVKLVTIEDAEWDTAEEYSLARFDTLGDIDESLYAPSEVDKFEALFTDLKFFLGRAVSVEAIVDYFDQLIDYPMPSLIETLIDQLWEKYLVGVTADADDLDAIDEIASMISDLATNPEYVDVYAWYVDISAAHDNLVAAAAATNAAETAIDAIGHVEYTTSKALIDAAYAEIEALNDTYFTNDAYLKYYRIEDATTLIANYDVYTAAVARYDQLTAADADKPEIIEKALNFDTVRPLWTDKAALDANLAEYNAWLAEYDLDETADANSIATMYPNGEIALLNKAVAYATAMDTIYTEHGVEALNALVDALTAKNPVLWTDKAESDGYVAAYEALEKAIADIDDYDPAIDTNYIEMVGADRKAAFEAIVARHKALDDANTALDALYDAMVGKVGSVTFQDYDAIVKLWADVKATFAAVDIIIDSDNDGKVDDAIKADANYIAFAEKKDPVALYEALYTEYRELTAKVREIYDTVTAALANADTLSLTFGNNIQDYLGHVRAIIALGVTDINLPLPGADGADEVNLNTLLANLSKVIKIYTERADAAVAESDAFTETLKTITGREPKNLNNFKAIEKVYKALEAWCEKYLGTDDIADIQAVQKYLATTGTYYEFITVAEYDKAMKAYNTAKDMYDKAYDDWYNNVRVELVGLTGDAKNNIHNVEAYATAKANYDKYLTKYYGGAILSDAYAVFDEVTVYAAFAADKKACEDKKVDADAASTEIKGRIDALAGIAVDYANYATVQAEVGAIKALIDTYKNTYCPDLCDECVGDARQVTLAQKDALAQLYAYAEAAKATNCPVLVDQEVLFYAGLINMDCEFGAISTIDTTLELAKSAVDAAVCVDEDGDNNHACDECGAPDITACVDDNTDHDCDECGANVGVHNDVVGDGDHACEYCGEAASACDDAVADGDHACDECGTELSACGDADADGNHACDECGVDGITDCVDADADDICDECGEAIVVAP